MRLSRAAPPDARAHCGASTGNQFRALEEDEVLFLDSVLEKQREEERLRKEMDGEELKNFRE